MCVQKIGFKILNCLSKNVRKPQAAGGIFLTHTVDDIITLPFPATEWINGAIVRICTLMTAFLICDIIINAPVIMSAYIKNFMKDYLLSIIYSLSITKTKLFSP